MDAGPSLHCPCPSCAVGRAVCGAEQSLDGKERGFTPGPALLGGRGSSLSPLPSRWKGSQEAASLAPSDGCPCWSGATTEGGCWQPRVISSGHYRLAALGWAEQEGASAFARPGPQRGAWARRGWEGRTCSRDPKQKALGRPQPPWRAMRTAAANWEGRPGQPSAARAGTRVCAVGAASGPEVPTTQPRL